MHSITSYFPLGLSLISRQCEVGQEVNEVDLNRSFGNGFNEQSWIFINNVAISLKMCHDLTVLVANNFNFLTYRTN